MRKVVKFGGSSLASAQQFEKVAEIVHAEASRRYVVPSAPGKRFRKDTKVTDMLYGCYALAEQDEEGRISAGSSVRSSSAIRRSLTVCP